MSMLMNYDFFNETMHKITKFLSILTIFYETVKHLTYELSVLWKHERANFMVMNKGSFNETMTCQILRIMNYEKST